MKHIWKYIGAAALIALAAVACKPEYPELVQSGLPSASDFDVTITVDQTTNQATFTLNNKGMVPVWNFGSELIDGKASKVYAYTGNGVTLRFREAGEHQVEVKAYNVNGISTGSVLKTFKMENTYRDPFDPSSYIRAISGGASQDWVWNSTENNHFGCGPLYTKNEDGQFVYAPNPLGWWQCPAGGKEGFMYDDVMTFDKEGNYTYDPGDGQAYAKKDAEYPDGHATGDDDYLFPAEKKTSKYTFENNWNEAGIEDIFLVLDPGSILSYVVHKSNVENPRYQVLETKTSEMKKKLKLMAEAFTPANPSPEGITFYYEFVPKGSVAGKEDPLFGTESKTWVLDNETAGYMGCGGSLNNPTEWWSAEPHNKDAYGVKDDALTFHKDGKYEFDPGADGMVYCNWDSDYHRELWDGVQNNDYDAPAEAQTSTYTLGSDADGDYIELPAGIFFGYVPNKAVLSQPTRLYVKENTDTKLVVVVKFEGICWQFIYRSEGAPAGDPLFGVVSKAWVYDNDAAGYMGCGGSIDNPTEWWSAEPHNKDAYGVKDDELTFYADGKYEFNPGADGVVYCNWDSDYHRELWDGVQNNDYDAPTEAQSSTYTLDADDNGDYIELPAGIFFGYVANKAVLSEPTRLYIKELTPTRLVLVAAFDGICWQFIYKPRDAGETPEEPADVEDAIVGSWTWDPDVNGHFGCGPDLGNPTGWWSGEAHCKDNAHMYDDVITITADGKYTLDPMDGFSYMNKDVTYLNDRKGDCPYGDDFCYTNTKTTWNYTLDEVGDYTVIKLADGGLFSYIPNNDFENEPWLYVKSYTKDQLVLMTYTATGNNGGAIAWQYILKRVQ
ncbi:MAG: hypothetical protein J5737_00925 [Bacteroidales bacterium]|nr:hypothetical protein [Bacteroidales bacterium]